MVSTEKQQVLDMLATGKVSVEQADQLLAALGESRAARSDDGPIVTKQRGATESTGQRSTGLSRELLTHLTAVRGDIGYITELRDSGLVDDLPQALLLGLTAVSGDITYMKALRDSGLIDDIPHDLLIELTAVSGDIDYIKGLRDAGLVENPVGASAQPSAQVGGATRVLSR